MRKQLYFLCLIVMTILAGTTACRSKEIELPFETIERDQSSGTGELWEPKEPGLLIMSTSDDLSQIDGLVTEDARTQLQNLDFDQYIAVAAFQGRQPYVVPGIEIQRISSKDGTITIYAHVLEFVGEVMSPLQVSPYHLVTVERGEDIQGEMEFVLNMDGKVVSRQTQILP